MSVLSISPTQLQQLQYPQGTGVYTFPSGGGVTATPLPQPSLPAAPMAAPAAAVAAAPGAAPAAATGVGAAAGATGVGDFGSIASGAINKIAGVASQYIGAKAQADTLKNTQAIPNQPEAEGPLVAFMAPKLGALGGNGGVTVQQ